MHYKLSYTRELLQQEKRLNQTILFASFCSHLIAALPTCSIFILRNVWKDIYANYVRFTKMNNDKKFPQYSEILSTKARKDSLKQQLTYKRSIFINPLSQVVFFHPFLGGGIVSTPLLNFAN